MDTARAIQGNNQGCSSGFYAVCRGDHQVALSKDEVVIDSKIMFLAQTGVYPLLELPQN
jgi:hypothetical protein